MGVRQLGSEVVRVERGVIKFGKDWPGIFIRGDEALALANLIRAGQDSSRLPKDDPVLRDLVRMLETCRGER